MSTSNRPNSEPPVATTSKKSALSSDGIPSMSKKPLPAPPKFDPSSIKVPKSLSTTLSSTASSRSKADAASSSLTLDLNLPRPPPLPLPRNKTNTPSSRLNSSTTATTSSSTAAAADDDAYNAAAAAKHGTLALEGSVMSMEKGHDAELTMDPKEGSGVKLPLDSAAHDAHAINESIRDDAVSQVMHSTMETIPKLDSAPPSFTSHSSRMDANNRSTEPSFSPLESSVLLPGHTSIAAEEKSNMDAEVPKIPHYPKRHVANIRRPKNSFLTESQRSIPILVVPTQSAVQIASRNNLTWSDLLNGLGNSMAKYSTSMLGKLAPIRSVNRMINLRWDMISFCFIEKFGYLDGYDTMNNSHSSDDNDNKDGKMDPGTEWEQRLSFASGNWEGEENYSFIENSIDSMIYRKGSRSSSGGGGENDDDGLEQSDPTAFLSTNETPWFARFRNGINQQTSHQMFSMLHAPIAVLYIGTSKEGIMGLENLVSREGKSYLPEEFRNGLFDPNAMKEQFLILHDEQDSSIASSFNEGKLIQEMRNRFGPGRVALVRVNSNTIEDSAVEEDTFWDEFLPPKAPKSFTEYTQNVHKVRGTLLSAKDKHALRAFIAQMVTTVVIPSIERRIYELNVEVTNHKKGVRNVLKSFWRKPKDTVGSNLSLHGPGSANPSVHGIGTNGLNAVPYRFDSIENQTRLLADTLFLIRDYEEAIAIFRIVKDDYRHDQNIIHNASAHEMMALSIYLNDLYTGSRNTREVIQYIDSALSLYSSAAEEERLKNSSSRPLTAPIPTRCVTRLCLLMSSTRMLCQGREMETADCLASASSKETPLGAAVLLEHSSVHYYRAGMRRKFAFHILMAGHMFRSAGQDHHAVRCFTSALCVYHGGDRYWPELFNHLTSALAGQLYAMKRMQLSLQLYARLVGTTGGGRVSVRSQQKFLDHLISICRSYATDAIESSKRMKKTYYEQNTELLNEIEEATPGVVRILEIPNMNLPKVFDGSIVVQNAFFSPEKSSFRDYATFGKPSEGDELIWQDMTCTAEAELRVHSVSEATQASTNFVNAVLDERDSERKRLQLQSRTKKSIVSNENLSSRAKLEPISVSFDISNPLSVMVPISSMQLVARLTCGTSHRIYTNVEAFMFKDQSSATKSSKKWKFSGSDKVFEHADFSRISPPTDSDENLWQCGESDSVEPYFLVTKQKMAMEPRSKVSVSLELCPLVMGKLEIIGVRCKVFNEIWVYHKFRMSGPPFQNKSSSHAHRIPADSSALCCNIGCNMPNLHVNVLRKSKLTKESLLQGQVNKWFLRVSNIGTAHATNLFLKTNLPWLNVLNTNSATQAVENPVSYCIGPTGTMFRLPLTCKESPMNCTLAPGETIDIPIEIRTSGGGKQDFYMLFRYELFEKSTSSNLYPKMPQVRWLRKMSSVAVCPSLTMAASITPFPGKEDYILSVEITNYRGDSETENHVTVDKIVAVSKNYAITPLNHHNHSFSQDQTISWQEQSVMHFIVRPLDDMLSTGFLSCCPLEQVNDETPLSSSITDYICLEHAHDQFTSRLFEREKELAKLEAEQEMKNQGPRSVAQIRRARSLLSSRSSDNVADLSIENKDSAHPTSRACLCSPHELNLICCWKTKMDDATDVIVKGQHHIRQLVVRPLHRSKTCPLAIDAVYDPHIKHDFSSGPLYVQVRVSVRNLLIHSTVKFSLSVCPIVDAVFSGIETFTKSLEGGEDISFPLEAIIFSGGVYNLQNMKLTVYDHHNNPEGTHEFPDQWILKVNA